MPTGQPVRENGSGGTPCQVNTRITKRNWARRGVVELGSLRKPPIYQLAGSCDPTYEIFHGLYPGMETSVFVLAMLLVHLPSLVDAHTIKVKLTVRMDAELSGTAREYRQVGRRP